MDLSELDFDLPDERVALRPVHPRSSARLLVSENDQIHDWRVSDLPRILRPGDRLILNDTRVIPALLHGVRHRPGAREVRISVNLDRPVDQGSWLALVRPARRIRAGDIAAFGKGLVAKVRERRDAFIVLDFQSSATRFESLLQQVGEMPLPPYISTRRETDQHDSAHYQTVFARRAGAVAAPTASLHFDDDLMTRLRDAGIRFSFVTLHVGAGTFLPIRSNSIDDHVMHLERGEVTEEAAAEINHSRATNGRIIAVGTTALRLLETAQSEGRVHAWRGETGLYIKPGHRFSVIDGLMTNFHLPRTTLLVLVAALVGRTRLQQIYGHALANDYRFFSYGDSSLLIP